MAWEWVAPVSSGVIGVAGIAAAVLTTRNAVGSAERVAEHTADRDLEVRRREERRESYTAFLDAVSDCDAAQNEILLGRLVDPDVMNEATHRTMQRWYSVALVGPETVAEAAIGLARAQARNCQRYVDWLANDQQGEHGMEISAGELGAVHCEMANVLGYKDADQLRTNEANPK